MQGKQAGKSIVVISIALLAACGVEPGIIADRVFLNGGVYTMDEEHRWAQAVAIKDGEIIFVGSNEDASDFIGELTQFTDLEGKMLMPGFIDSHTHILSGGSSLNRCNLQDSNDPERIRVLLEECRDNRDYGPDDWVLGGQWQLSAFGPEGPNRQVLDEVFGNRPASFLDSFGHNSWVSTRALELAGIDAGTENPVGGVIVRDPESGEATGTLRESAMTLVDEVTPVASTGQQAADLAAGLAEAARFGITAFTEPGLSAAQLAPYVEADQNRTLTARVLVSLTPIGTSVAPFDESVYELVEQRETFNGNYLKTDSVKVFMDGVIETKTSYMLEPYTDDQSNFEALYDQDTANEFYQKLDAMGVQVHTHAIGDGAIRRALNAYQYALEQNGPSDSRHQIAHLQLIDPADIPRFGELNVAADFQPLWAYPDQYIDLAVTVVGQERVDRFYPIASIDATGGLIIGGSDWSVSSLNPLDAIEVAVTRQDPNATGGLIHQESERMDLATILDAYTRNGAWVMKLDDEVGSIEVGKRADLIVLDKNLFEIPAEDINSSKVLMTMLDGKIIYQAE